MNKSSTRNAHQTANSEASASAKSGFKHALHLAFWPFLLSRMWVFFFAYWGQSEYARAGKYLKPFRGGWEGVSNWWLNPWTTYDSERFIHVAERGYDVVTSVSFPLYSVLLMPFKHSEIAMAVWGISISNVAFFFALSLLFRLTERDFDSKVAKIAIWALAFFPATVIFSAVYAESVFLLLVLLTFWNARGGHWKWAALFGLLAGLTRNSGPILFAALLIEYSMQRRSAQISSQTQSDESQISSARNANIENVEAQYSRTRDNENKSEITAESSISRTQNTPSWFALLATTAPLLGFIAFQIYIGRALQANDLMLRQAHALGRTWMTPWTPLWKELHAFLFENHIDVTTTVNLWTTFFAIFLAIRFWRRGRFSYTVLLGGILLSFLTYGVTYASYTVGAMRYLAVTFPMQQRIALWARPVAERPISRGMLIFIALAISAWVAFSFGRKVYLF